MTDHEGPVPGWYPDAEVPGGERYWDGAAWTEHRRPAPQAAQGWTGQQATGPRADPPAAGPWAAPSTTGPSWAAPEAIDTWLWQSIVATILCCQPLGIVGIVMSALAGSARDAGNLALAKQRASQARTWTLVAVGVGLAAYLGGFLLMMLGFFAAW